MNIHTKRVYDAPSRSDGLRILADRLWPRGLTKDAAALDHWPKDLTPSNDLRKWYHANTTEWAEFKKRYKAELKENKPALDELVAQIRKSRRKTITLLTAAKDESQNHTHILRDTLARVL